MTAAFTVQRGRRLLAAMQLFFVVLVLPCGSLKPGACYKSDETASATSSQLRTLRASSSSAGHEPGQRRKLPEGPMEVRGEGSTTYGTLTPLPELPPIPIPSGGQSHPVDDITKSFAAQNNALNKPVEDLLDHNLFLSPAALLGTRTPAASAPPRDGTPSSDGIPSSDVKNQPKRDQDIDVDKWNTTMVELGTLIGNWICMQAFCNKSNLTDSNGWGQEVTESSDRSDGLTQSSGGVKNLTQSNGTQRFTSSFTAALPMPVAGLLLFIVLIAM